MPSASFEKIASDSTHPDASLNDVPSAEERLSEPRSSRTALYPVSRHYHKTHKPSTPWTHLENKHLIANRLVGFSWADISKYFQSNQFNKTDADCMHQARCLYASGEWMEVLYDYAWDDIFPPPPKYMVDGSDQIKHRWYCKILAEIRRRFGSPHDRKKNRASLPGAKRSVLVLSVDDRKGIEILFEFGDLRYPRADTAPHVAKEKTVR